MNVGFIGTGTMGLPMLTNLIKGGHSVMAFDVNPSALDDAVARGATRGNSATSVAGKVEMLVTVLPSSSHVESAYLDEGGILEGAKAGLLCADMSTIDPNTSRKVAAALENKGARFIDAPVSGGTVGAENATLAIMVGGAAADLEAARPVLASMGANIIHVGTVGTGEAAKICNNLIAGVAAVAVAEAFRIGEAFGVDPKILTDVISKSSGNTWAMQHAHPVPGIVETAPSTRNYAPGFMTDLMAKDLALGVNAARELRIPVFVSPVAQQLLRLASSQGLGREDFTSVYKLLSPSDKRAPV